MGSLALLVVCFVVGVLARRSGALPEDSPRVFNAWALYVSLPALVFRAIHHAPLEGLVVLESALLWLVFLVPAAVAWLVVKRGTAVGPVGAVALCAGLGNTAFVGLPLLEAVAGKDVLATAAVVDQLGSFLALFALAMPFAAKLAGGEASLAVTVKKLIRSPAMIALVFALLLRGVEVPGPALVVIDRLADMLSPLALAVIGWQLDLSALPGNGRAVAVGLGWKLLGAPAMVLGVLWLFRGSLGVTERVVVAQAAMAPMVTAGVVASENRLSPNLAAAMIGVGVPLSVLTVPVWWRVMAG